MRKIAVLLATTSFLACSPQYAYVPLTNATSSIAGRSALDYPIPPQAPKGDVRIASFGMTNLTAKATPQEKIRAVHLRMIVANNSDTPWQVDTREQRLDLAGFGPSVPAFASANPGSQPPRVTIAPGGKRTVDLFFPLPPSEQHASKVPSFDALWQVKAGTELVKERAPFERIRIEPAPSVYDYGGDYWWAPPTTSTPTTQA
jgi:hypothetical protein